MFHLTQFCCQLFDNGLTPFQPYSHIFYQHQNFCHNLAGLQAEHVFRHVNLFVRSVSSCPRDKPDYKVRRVSDLLEPLVLIHIDRDRFFAHFAPLLFPPSTILAMKTSTLPLSQISMSNCWRPTSFRHALADPEQLGFFEPPRLPPEPP